MENKDYSKMSPEELKIEIDTELLRNAMSTLKGSRLLELIRDFNKGAGVEAIKEDIVDRYNIDFVITPKL